MTRIHLRNPYWDKEYDVKESAKYINMALNNIIRGYDTFMLLTTENGALAISPEHLATIEVIGGEEE